MSYEELLEEEFLKLGLQIQPDLDTTAETEYIVYGYDSEGMLYGDDSPCLDYRRWSIWYVASVAHDRREMRQAIREAVQRVTGIWPSEENASDVNGQRFIYEFETFGGISCGEA